MYEKYCLLGYDGMQTGRSLPPFRRNILPLSSGAKCKSFYQETSSKQSGALRACTACSSTLKMEAVTSKFGPRGVISQKIEIVIVLNDLL
jgi:hypothetical protein